MHTAESTTNKRFAISNTILLSCLFIITNIEWHFYSIYQAFKKFDRLACLIVLIVVFACYITNVKASSSDHYIIPPLTKVQFILISLWMGFFFFYWTVDVKGYFKGYDVYYGSMILFVGFVYTFILVECIKYYVLTLYKGKNIILLYLKNNSHIIGLFQALLVALAYKIMMWYQSPVAFSLTALFVVLIIIPEEISPYRMYCSIIRKLPSRLRHINVLGISAIDEWNYFGNVMLSAIITHALMFILALRHHHDVIAAPFVLSFVCLGAILRYFVTSEEGNSYHVYDSTEYRTVLKKYIPSNIVVATISALTVIIPIAILGPLENYYSNVGEFEFACSDFFINLVIHFALVLVVFTISTMFLRQSSFWVICSVVFSFGITTYIQIMFLNKQLSMSNGDSLDIASLGSYPIINIVMWCVIALLICVIMYLAKDNRKSILLLVGGGVCAVQLIAAISLPLTIYSGDKSVSYCLVSNDEFQLASKENVIVFILDTYGNVQLDNAKSEYPDILDGFEDFTYYNNADCCYAWTYPSLNHMLTGQDIDYKLKSMEKWCDVAWHKADVQEYYKKIKDAGYSLKLYTPQTSVVGNGVNVNGIFDNLRAYGHEVDSRKVAYKMYRYSLYKALPYVFKAKYQEVTDNFFGLTTINFDEGDLPSEVDLKPFYDRLSNGLGVNYDEKKAIRIIHLFGTHKDLVFGKDFQDREDVPRNEVAYANMKLMKMYMDEVKRLGLYDDSTIIIMGDHGTYYDVIDPQPILFVKEKNAHADKMKVNSAPVSHSDFRASLLDYIGLDYSEYGRRYKDINESEARERTCGYVYYDRDTYFYTYTGDRENLLKLFPNVPTYIKSF